MKNLDFWLNLPVFVNDLTFFWCMFVTLKFIISIKYMYYFENVDKKFALHEINVF